MERPRNIRLQLPLLKKACLGIWVFLVSVMTIPALGLHESAQFAERVNLALRRTAHQLLIESGDTLLGIPPVEQPDSATFIIRIDSLFDYDKLPFLLKESLELHGIRQAYHVAILSCADGKIQLGYSYFDLVEPGGVPCTGRRKEAGCYLLKVRFTRDSPDAAADGKWWIVSITCLLAGLGYIVFRRSGKKSPAARQADSAGASARQVKIGNSILDFSNLLLKSGSKTHSLTYREAKLLNLFAVHQNQLLERDFILRSVWEDEGITVDRSIDVFVSRLRKLLQDDGSVKIVAVYGVGYRMEILKIS